MGKLRLKFSMKNDYGFEEVLYYLPELDFDLPFLISSQPSKLLLTKLQRFPLR